MKILIAFALILTAGTTVWLTDFEAAKQQASTEKKLILLNFSGSDWCAPCIRLKKEVFETNRFDEIASKRLVLLRADFPRQKKNKLSPELTKHNEALAEKYNPAGKFPFTVLLDENGKVLREWDGYVFGSQEEFLSNLDSFLMTH